MFLSTIFQTLSATGTSDSFSFAFSGDTGQYGNSFNANQTAANQTAGSGSFFFTAASLQALPRGLSFFVNVGDISYNGTSNGYLRTGNEVSWCNFVKSQIETNLGSDFPWIQVVGNHEDGNQPVAPDGYIDAFTAPDCLPKPAGIGFVPSTVGCPDATLFSGCYGREGYWDFPPERPLARFIMIAGAEKVGNGTTPSTYGYCPLSACNKQSPYAEFDKRWFWLKNTIEEAKSNGEWVIVLDHKLCLSPDLNTACEGSGIFNGHNPGAQKWNLLFSENVDLVINGHAHIHARSKQLTCYGPQEPMPTSLNSVSYSPSCVSDDGSDNVYIRGRGVVNVIDGAFSQQDGQLNFTRADTNYFASAMSARTTPTVTPRVCCWVNGSPTDMTSGIGFGVVRVSATELNYTWRMSYTTRYLGSQSPIYGDTFVIRSDSPPRAAQEPFIPSFLTQNIAVIAGVGIGVVGVAFLARFLTSRRRVKVHRVAASAALS